ncbi:MAG TPA: hypothetical protein PK299_15595 [Anaerolineales bacterium]|nr:hypothetical protein [Anaerolineales bacterium]
MDIMKWFFILYGIVMVAIGLYAFGIGAWGFVKKRPLIVAARQLMWFLLAIYVPQTIQAFVSLPSFWGRGDLFFTIIPIIEIVALVLLVFIFWRQMAGYMILGVSDETFREALVSALNKLNLPYQETISKIKLTGLGADMQVVVASWTGTAQIRIKQWRHVRYTKKIALAMDDYYKNNPVKVNNSAFIVYLLLGILMIVFVVVVAFGFFGSGFLFRSY